MWNPRAIHVVPLAGGRWEVRLDGCQPPLRFGDLGSALDAATLAAAGAEPIRVVVHEPSAAA